ncbi:hypothetical protein CHS0354_025690 [Potamilus streckersoni]|uniref:Uncharacterized protein n=1 Tax=Potamilus streckersoni TaxID=2493646 RepID=A0AAE0S0W5_9BIVA|nr:hypothetical protein CHS0354_025690 [Potamilus streckersoni]
MPWKTQYVTTESQTDRVPVNGKRRHSWQDVRVKDILMQAPGKDSIYPEMMKPVETKPRRSFSEKYFQPGQKRNHRRSESWNHNQVTKMGDFGDSATTKEASHPALQHQEHLQQNQFQEGNGEHRR